MITGAGIEAGLHTCFVVKTMQTNEDLNYNPKSTFKCACLKIRNYESYRRVRLFHRSELP
jgi:hypothetical protein